MYTGPELKSLLDSYDHNGDGFFTVREIRDFDLGFPVGFYKLLEYLADDDGNVMINKFAGKFIQSHKNLIQQYFAFSRPRPTHQRFGRH